MARPTQGSVTSKQINMSGQTTQGPSKTIPPTVLLVKQPQPGPRGNGLGDDDGPAIEPVVSGPNKAFSEGNN